MNEAMQKYDTLVLSGGGIKGFYLLGGIFACVNSGYIGNHITTYIGTSVGAIICYLLCIGYDPISIITCINSSKCLDQIPDFSVLSLANGKGAMNFSMIYNLLEEMSINKTGKIHTLNTLKDECNKTLIVCTYNITKNMTEYIGPDNHPDMSCLTALRLSCNIPFVFEPYRYLDCFYVDGGVSDNFPVKKAISMGGNVLGMYIQLDVNALKYCPNDSLVSYAVKLLQIPIFKTQEEYKNVKGAFMIPIHTHEFYSFASFNIPLNTRLNMISSGYSEVEKVFENFRNPIPKESEIQSVVKPVKIKQD